MIPNMPLYKSKTCLEMIQNTHPSPTKKAVPNVNMFDFVGEIVGGILCIYIVCILCMFITQDYRTNYFARYNTST